MKTKEELNALKEEVETVSRKLHELTEEELAQVSGGGSTIDVTIDGATIDIGDVSNVNIPNAEEPICASCTVG